MKTIKINKQVWRQLLQIKNEHKFSNHSLTLKYLIDSCDVLKGEKQLKKIVPASLRKNNDFIDKKQRLADIYRFLDGKKDEQVYASTKKT